MPTAAMMLSGATTGGGGGGPSDIPTLVTALGGDSVVGAFYDARTLVRVNGSNVRCVEDARQTSFSGRYFFSGKTDTGIDCGRCTAFDGISKLTIVAFGVKYQSIGTICAVSTNGATSPFIFYQPDATNLKFLCGASSTVAQFTMSGTVVPLGSIFKVMFVYDGTLSVGSRASAYVSILDRSTGTWGARSALTKTSDNVPATLATTSTEKLYLGGWQNGGAFGNAFSGCLDSVRFWTGTALTTTQLDAETITTNALTANFAYEFASDASNTGSTSGNNGTPAGDAILCARDYTYGTPLGYYGGNAAPTYDGSSAITIAASPIAPLYAGSPGITQDGGAALVATEPTVGGSPTVSVLVGGAQGSGDEYLTTYKSGATMNIWSGAGGPSIASAAGTRVLHTRHAGTGASVTVALRDGTATEATSTGSFSATTPQEIVVGRGVSANPADITFKALIVLVGTITSGQQSSINTWAAAHHGATV